MSDEQGAARFSQAVPFFAVSDMERSLKFYTDGLGFEIDNKWVVDGKVNWCWLQRDDVAIMLQEFRTEGNNARLFAWENAGEGVSVNVKCGDAKAYYEEITAKGVEAEKPFVGNRLLTVGVNDPDGYRLSFDSPTDLPEGECP